jgi:hypothetical protein
MRRGAISRRRKGLVLGAGLALAAAVAAPAVAQEVCAGTERTAYVCSDPTGATLIDDCVYTGGSGCTQVTVPGPTLSCGGDLITAIRCGSPR